jgi:hypothetical protein
VLSLLDGEEVVYDLRRGTIQRLTYDFLRKRTILLTNRRVVFVNNNAGTYSIEPVPLQDVQSVSSVRRIRVKALIADLVMWLLTVGLFLSIVTEGSGAGIGIIGAVAGLFAVILAFGISQHVILISTVKHNFEFPVERMLSIGVMEMFLDQVQQQVAELKSREASGR